MIGLGFTNPVRAGGVLDVFVWCRWGVGSGYWYWTRVWLDGVVLCLCESGFSV